MTTVERHAPSASRVLRHLDEAVAHVRDVCFTTGPPGLIGVELEWTVHHVDAPARDLDVVTLRAALGPHALRANAIRPPCHRMGEEWYSNG